MGIRIDRLVLCADRETNQAHNERFPLPIATPRRPEPRHDSQPKDNRQVRLRTPPHHRNSTKR